jgi:hypothetical protein
MAGDNYVLYGPEGSAYNLGSFVLSDPGPDFGEQDLLRANYAENPAAEGGVLAFETTNIRRMQFPLRLASHSAWSGVNGLSAMLRRAARPGAYIDLQPDGVASGEAIRFDVAAGRLELAYEIRQYGQLDRIPATLKLDVQPFGYWPTMILLASAASVGGPGVLALDTTKLIGDVPGLAEVFIAPTSATSYGLKQMTDAAFWSLGARPSFQAWWVAPSAIASGPNGDSIPTLLGDKYAPGSQTVRFNVASSGLNRWDQWNIAARFVIPPSLEPAYRGRFRALAWARVAPSGALPWQVSIDITNGTSVTAALASAAPVATVPPAVASDFFSGGRGASPAFSLLDLGEVSLPPIASTAFETVARLWTTIGTNAPGAPTVQLDLAGLYFMPLDGAAGLLAQGLIRPSWYNANFTGGLYLNSLTGEVSIQSATAGVASLQPHAQAVAFHRGVLPRVGASTIQLDLLLAGRNASQLDIPTAQPPLRSEPHFAQVSVRYRPRFTFMKGL